MKIILASLYITSRIFIKTMILLLIIIPFLSVVNFYGLNMSYIPLIQFANFPVFVQVFFVLILYLFFVHPKISNKFKLYISKSGKKTQTIEHEVKEDRLRPNKTMKYEVDYSIVIDGKTYVYSKVNLLDARVSGMKRKTSLDVYYFFCSPFMRKPLTVVENQTIPGYKTNNPS